METCIPFQLVYICRDSADGDIQLQRYIIQSRGAARSAAYCQILQLKFYIQDNVPNESELKEVKLDYAADPFGVEAFDAPKFFVRLVDRNGKRDSKNHRMSRMMREKGYI